MPEFVTHDEYEGREKLCDERFARDKHQIDENKAMLQELRDCNIKLTQMIERHDKELEAQAKRLSAIEHAPADTYGKLKVALITAVVTGFAGYIVSAIVAAAKQ